MCKRDQAATVNVRINRLLQVVDSLFHFMHHGRKIKARAGRHKKTILDFAILNLNPVNISTKVLL